MAASYCCAVFWLIMDNKSSEIKAIEYTCNGKSLTFIKPLVMAIVNLTPDSFYDGSRYSSVKDVIRDVEEKIAQGADIIDVGAASTRPGAELITEEEEWARAKEALYEIRKRFPHTFLSIDTFRSGVALRAADAGADIINDISGGSMDAGMADAVAKLQLPYILMHIKGTPQTMQQNPNYENVAAEVKEFFVNQTITLNQKGFHKIILDPGFGFGKTADHNFSLLKQMPAFGALGYPLLAGISRKSMINKVIGTNPVTALNGTTVLNTIALLNGCNILRVHDVIEAKQCIKLVEFYKNV